jgi:DNA-binding LacI/PurR family transcriptional regulator
MKSRSSTDGDHSTVSARPRMRDIAQLAGVSIGTVSRIYNGNTGVAADLVESVLRAAKRLGYEKRGPKGNGAPAEKELGNVGYLIADLDLSENGFTPYHQHIVAGIEKAASDLRGHLIFARSRIESAELPAMLAEAMVRGVIIKGSPPIDWSWVENIHQVAPVVLVMNSNPARSIPSVSCDNQAGTYQVLKYLRELGHERIGFLSVSDLDPKNPGTPLRTATHHEERLVAFRHYAPAFGCIEHPAYIQLPTRDSRRETLLDAIEKAVRNYVELGAERPTALVCATDIYAFSVFNLAARYGIAIPRDMSVASFMNTEGAEFSVPSLTSVDLAEEEVGRTALHLLRDYLQDRNLSVRHVQVATRLVERLSCQKLPTPNA